MHMYMHVHVPPHVVWPHSPASPPAELWLCRAGSPGSGERGRHTLSQSYTFIVHVHCTCIYTCTCITSCTASMYWMYTCITSCTASCTGCIHVSHHVLHHVLDVYMYHIMYCIMYWMYTCITSCTASCTGCIHDVYMYHIMYWMYTCTTSCTGCIHVPHHVLDVHCIHVPHHVLHRAHVLTSRACVCSCSSLSSEEICESNTRQIYLSLVDTHTCMYMYMCKLER